MKNDVLIALPTYDEAENVEPTSLEDDYLVALSDEKVYGANATQKSAAAPSVSENATAALQSSNQTQSQAANETNKTASTTATKISSLKEQIAASKTRLAGTENTSSASEQSAVGKKINSSLSSTKASRDSRKPCATSRKVARRRSSKARQSSISRFIGLQARISRTCSSVSSATGPVGSRGGLLSERGCFGAPDWVVEILSPWTLKKDLDAKFSLYERNHVREYWIIDPDSRSIEVFALAKGLYQLHSRASGSEAAKSKLLAGFKVSFSQLLG